LRFLTCIPAIYRSAAAHSGATTRSFDFRDMEPVHQMV
jgi:hypothetical protein